MDTILIHLIKSSGIALLFLVCYHLFLKKETFFNANRWFLLSGLLISFVLPFITLTNEVFITSYPIFETTENTVPITTTSKQFNWIFFLLLSIYIFGAVLFIVKLLIQFTAIHRLIKATQIQKKDDFYLVNTSKNTAPFSFFKYIFYNSSQFNTAELNSVLSHEKVHACQYHSLDILLMELLFITQWFNPTIWWYKKSMKQNLEFLADAKACSKTTEKKFYQYLMLKQAVGIHSSSIVNPFYNSLIKKRIVMLNQKQSKKSNLFKMLFVLPVLALFLVSFNTETVYVLYPNETKYIAEKEKIIEVIITKDTSDNALLEIKNTMTKEGVDFSYTVVHNKKGEIIDISIQINADKNANSYNANSEAPIRTILIVIDEDKNISIGNENAFDRKTIISKHSDKNGNSYRLTISDDDDKSNNTIQIQSTNNKHQTIEIENVNGTETIKMNGEVITKQEFNKMNIRSVSIISDDVDENKKPQFIVDGKKVSNKEFEKLKPDNIESISVLKGEAAIKKYGEKAKNGVIEITTKKK